MALTRLNAFLAAENSQEDRPHQTTESEESTSRMLTVHELAGRLRVPDSWIYTHADELGTYRLGKYLRFSWKRVLQLLEAKGRGTLGSQPNDLPQKP